MDDSPAGCVDVRLAIKLVTLLADSIKARKFGLVVDTQTAQAGKAALEDALRLDLSRLLRRGCQNSYEN